MGESQLVFPGTGRRRWALCAGAAAAQPHSTPAWILRRVYTIHFSLRKAWKKILCGESKRQHVLSSAFCNFSCELSEQNEFWTISAALTMSMRLPGEKGGTERINKSPERTGCVQKLEPERLLCLSGQCKPIQWPIDNRKKVRVGGRRVLSLYGTRGRLLSCQAARQSRDSHGHRAVL